MLWRRTFVAALAVGFAHANDESVIEPADFNVTAALEKHGVEVSQLPGVGDELQGRSSGLACSIACNSLRTIFGREAVHLQDEASYTAFTDGYWSLNQAVVDPYCVFVPAKAEDVSVVVLLSRLTQCPFAAKSGGHASMANASSIEGGITVSFAKFKSLKLNKDRSIASIGPGQIWGDVYENLAQSDLTVIGGRLYNIGVGGLTTGGGISYFSSRHGWACDNVESYDIVLANGAIVSASAKKYSDLFWAVKGGGNNFGLIVNFNLRTYPLPGGKLWGGLRVYTEENLRPIASAYQNMLVDTPKDPDAGMYVVWAYRGGAKLAIPNFYHAKLDAGNEPVWREFNALQPVQDTTQNRVIAEWAQEGIDGVPPGFQQCFYTLTFKADLDLLNFGIDTFYQEVPALNDVAGINPNFVSQGITVPMMQAMKAKGGNALGLNPEEGPLHLILLTFIWDSADDDALVYSVMSKILSIISAEAKKRGVDNDYVYMNYASQYQDVVRSYGKENKDKLKKIASLYDPQRVYQTLEPGYFKLDRGPISDPAFFSG